MNTIQWPNSYVVFDIETNGLDIKNGHILEIGALKVFDGQVVEKKNWVMGDMTVPISPEITALTGITYDTIREEGRPPRECIEEFRSFLRNDRDQRYPHVTHNGLRFDIPFLLNYAARLYEKTPAESSTIEMQKNAIDTAAMYKAKKMDRPRMWNESFAEWAMRVLEERAYGVKYNVRIACEELGISMEGVAMHRAGGDIELTNKIYRAITGLDEAK